MRKKSQSQLPDFASFPIVGVGASAGGLEAFRDLLRRLSPAPRMAIVLVQHLAPEHESILAELLSRGSRMPVRQITDGMTVEPNVIYVIPPNVNLAMAGKKLKLLPRTPTRGLHMPIDHFFQTLAHEHGSRVIGVILSGTASDGAAGIEAIKSAGGITMVQDPKTAKFSGMPSSAIATGAADFILSVEGIAQELMEISRHPYVSRLQQVHQGEAIRPPDELDNVFSLLQVASGVDFRHYKHNTIQRRIQRRMTLHKILHLKDYAKLLRRNREELDALYHDILIKVTGFFREPQTFEIFKREILPALLKPNSRGTPPSPLRIWVPGCAAGEEAYSLAICLLEFLGDRAASTPFQIFATDIDEKALAKARAGLYMENIATDVSPERLQAFFAKVNQNYQINRSIRDLCLFAKHNVIKDPPFSNLDLISCRNVLIYLGQAVHQNVFSTFHYALKPNGYLILGASESIGTSTDFFQPAHKKHKIYSKRLITLRPHPHLDFLNKEYLSEDVSRVRSQEIPRVQPLREGDLIREADRLVLGHYVPAGVLINDRMEILQFRGDTSPYLTPPPGKATFDLLKMAREGLLVELRAALLQARKGGTSVKKEGVLIQHNGQSNEVIINVVPLKTPQTTGRFFLVLFEEPATLKPKEEKRPVKPNQAVDSERVEQLQQEQASMKQYLQAIIEQQEATNEELESANEEILSSNEELQSTNEELETAKEELQSTNEELITVNEEIRNRNQELAQLNNDLTNVLASVKPPIIMLGRDLRIRHFTPAAETLLKLIPTDMGRPITDLRLTIEIPELAQWIHAVIKTVRAKEQEVQDQAGQWYSLQIQPYKTLDNKIDGAVLVFIDIEKLRALAHTRAQKERLESLSRRLMEAHEDERRAIARDLHDEVGQDLTALKLNVQTMQGVADAGNASAKREAVRIVDQLIQKVRNLSLNLRPSLLDDLGLVATLRWWVEHQGPLVGVNLELAAEPIEPRLPRELATACFRIVQEAVNNAIKHARPQGVSIALRKQDDRLELTVRDDGVGFDIRTALAETAQGKTIGLVGMEERVRAIGGRLTIQSEPGRGTEIHATFPLS